MELTLWDRATDVIVPVPITNACSADSSSDIVIKKVSNDCNYLLTCSPESADGPRNLTTLSANLFNERKKEVIYISFSFSLSATSCCSARPSGGNSGLSLLLYIRAWESVLQRPTEALSTDGWTDGWLLRVAARWRKPLNGARTGVLPMSKAGLFCVVTSPGNLMKGASAFMRLRLTIDAFCIFNWRHFPGPLPIKCSSWS